jgi:hypothetical protein
MLACEAVGIVCDDAWADPASVSHDECSAQPCRDARVVDIALGDGAVFRASIPRSPYLTEEHHIVLFPGERVVFRFSLEGEQLAAPKFISAETLEPLPSPDAGAYDKVDKLSNQPPGTLMLTYQPAAGARGMVLLIEHNLPQPLKMKAFVNRMTPDGWKLSYTSTCRIPPNLAEMETWGEPLGLIILEDFRLLSNTDAMSCE